MRAPAAATSPSPPPSTPREKGNPKRFVSSSRFKPLRIVGALLVLYLFYSNMAMLNQHKENAAPWNAARAGLIPPRGRIGREEGASRGDRELPLVVNTEPDTEGSDSVTAAENATYIVDGLVSIVVPVRQEVLPAHIVDAIMFDYADPVAKKRPSPIEIEVVFVVQGPRLTTDVAAELKRSADQLKTRATKSSSPAASSGAVIKDIRLKIEGDVPSSDLATKGETSGEENRTPESAGNVRVRSFGELSNAGAEHASQNAQYLIFLSEMFALPNASTAIRKMVSLLANTQAEVVSCQMVEPDGHGHLKILEHGVEVSLGRDHSGSSTRSQSSEQLFMAKVLSGHAVGDRRSGWPRYTPATSPYCMLIRRSIFFEVRGFGRLSSLSTIQTMYGGSFKQESKLALDRLRLAIVGLEQVMEGVSIKEMQQNRHPLRKLVRKAYATAVEASAVWESSAKLKWSDPRKPALSKTALFESERILRSASSLNVQERIDAMNKRVASQLKIVKDFVLPSGASGWEEEQGWELALRLQRAGHRAVASTARAVLNHSALPQQLAAFQTENPDFDLHPPSIPVAGMFQKEWGERLRALHRSRSEFSEAPLKIVWESFCCHCCGFANEIVHLTFPLMRLQSVSLAMEPECFCQGFPSAIDDFLKRSYISKEQYAAGKTADDEVLVWVAHRDPTGYVHPMMESRRPDYIVGRSMYEFSRIDLNWVVDGNNNGDEIWAPGQWVRHMFIASGVKAEKIRVVPESIDTFFLDPDAQRVLSLPQPSKPDPVTDENGAVVTSATKKGSAASRPWNQWCNKPVKSSYPATSVFDEAQQRWVAGASDAAYKIKKQQSRGSSHPKSGGHKPPPSTGRYKFFSNFKWEDRKGWEIMFQAYHEAFKADAPVSLYVLTHIWFPGGPETYGDPHNTTFLREQIAIAARKFGVEDLEDMPHFCIVADHLSEVEVAELYNSIDAFVLPTRGEGWGLPSIQAMSMGKPTISTDWGGQTEFMKPDVSFPIPIDGIEEISEDSVYRWRFGKKWGIPSLTETTKLMQLVFRKRVAATEVGRRARKYVEENFSEEVVAKIIDKRLLEIREIVRGRRRNRQGLKR